MFLTIIIFTQSNSQSTFVYVEQLGQKVSDSDQQLSNNKIESFANLIFKSATAEKSGYIIQVINGTKYLLHIIL